MERIFKIKTKTSPDPRGLYPSERRYSASIVIGLSVVFLQLALYSILMGSLIVHKVNLYESFYRKNGTFIEEDLENITDSTEESLKRFERDLVENDKFGLRYYIDIPALVCAGCFVMALGEILCFFSGLLAWKRWYIDHNITFFFLSTSFCTLTSTICLLISLLTTFHMDFYNFDTDSPITFSLAMNVIILSFVSSLWSFLATKVSYRGMRNEYPDDIIISKGGGMVEVSVIRKGNKNGNVFPPEILDSSHLGKLAKYLPQPEYNGNLPKAESNAEYQQRVDKFLNGGNADAK